MGGGADVAINEMPLRTEQTKKKEWRKTAATTCGSEGAAER